MVDNPSQVTADRYYRLLQISRDLASTLELPELLKRIVHAASDLCNARAASILLYDDKYQELRFEAATNIDSPVLRGMVVPVETSIAGWIVNHREPVIISDARQDERIFRQVGEQANLITESLLGVPLIAKDKVIGVLEAINKDVGTFTNEDLELLIVLGAQAAVAIENSRLFLQSDLISDLVHELRTPMSSLETAAHLLTRSDISEQQRIQYTQIIRDEIDRLSELTTTYLDYSRLESGRMQFVPEFFDLKALLEDCLQVMQVQITARNLKLILDLPDDLPKAYGDQNRIKQVFHNLVSNAIKYNSSEGYVTVSTRHQKDELVFSVTDTGPGIPPENLDSLFIKFYRVPGTEKLASGTGLGLSICKYIVEAHQGRITVNSQVGKGTTFTVHLPLPIESD